MRYAPCSCTLAAVLALFAATAGAGEFYAGTKIGTMAVDVSDADDPTNVGLTLGYGQGVVFGQLALEGEYTTTLDEGSIGASGIEVDTVGAYLAVRTAGPFYLKARGGLVNVDTKIGSTSTSSSGFAFGAGIGFGVGIAQMELEFTAMEDSTRFLSLGAQF